MSRWESPAGQEIRVGNAQECFFFLSSYGSGLNCGTENTGVCPSGLKDRSPEGKESLMREELRSCTGCREAVSGGPSQAGDLTIQPVGPGNGVQSFGLREPGAEK